MEDEIEKGDLLKLAQFLGLGFYRVNDEGQFLQCDSTAREIFGIPQEEADLSKYTIKDFYVVPAERELRLKKLIENNGKALSGTLSLRIKGKTKFVFDICWYEKMDGDRKFFAGLVDEIENSTIFPKMFDTFPMGLYETNEKGSLVRANQKLLEIFDYKTEEELLGKPIKEFYQNEKDLEEYIQEVINKGYASKILKLKDSNNKPLDIECFTQDINEFEMARWGLLKDVTKRERYYRALDRMPTGFYHVEYAENDETHEKERIAQCNDHFARLLGFENSEKAIGKNIAKLLHPDEEEGKKFFEALDKADQQGEALLNYPFRAKKYNSNKIIHISIDSHLIKDSQGKVIGREGTIRDITEKVELEKKVQETEERQKKTTEDINRLIHTFLHPVLKFAGNSEQLLEVGTTLFKTIQPERQSVTDTPPNINGLGKEIETILAALKSSLPNKALPDTYNGKKDTILENGALNPLAIDTLKDRLEEMIRMFDHSLNSEKSAILLDSDIRDTALLALEELDKIQYFHQDGPKYLLERNSVEFLQGILFNYIIRIARILEGEAKIMKIRIETLRDYIVKKKERPYYFEKRTLNKILEENLRLFKPLLQEKNIEIRYDFSGNLSAEISPNDIDRVVCNLLHNAKKYSISGKGRYVKVEARGTNETVEFSVSSYGIPVKREEIESGKIFEFGTRSELAYQSDRDGTGVGLADAKEVVEAHGGNITLTSTSKDDSDPPEYKVPYLTTIKISIPRNRKGGNHGN
jgi:PAS domain S-box-containing protein